MQIVVIAPAQTEAEFRQKFAGTHKYLFFHDYNHIRKSLPEAALVFDFLLPETPEALRVYQERSDLVVFCHAVNIALADLVHRAAISPEFVLFGFNGWPTMINRSYLEVSVLREQDKPVLAEVCKVLGTEYLVVDDRVGMATPRILSMIINEAFYTLQEGTATRPAIDLAMKLGTNYPFGPFKWAEKIGLAPIYSLLDALYQDTKDERYKICPLLKKEYLKSARAAK
jgi:3-hydroxybutyryl-CoA dehydrogenase